MKVQVNKVVDAKGLSCPMPIVKTKKGMDEITPGQVIEVQATDKGSLADIKAWAKSTGHEYIGTTDEDNVLKHYIRKSSSEEVKSEETFPHTISQEEVEKNLNSERVTILDVREPAEYAFNHIPDAVSIPFGELENRLDELDKNNELYVVCRTSHRSDMASKLLSSNGFNNVKKVVPGMSEWQGPMESKNK